MQPSLKAALSGAALALLAATPGRAAEPEIGRQASSGDLVVMQIATTDPKTLMDSWGKEADGVKIASADAMKRNQPIATFLLFSGCRPDAEGNCNVTADFQTLAPGGAVYDKQTGVKVWVGRPAPPPKSIGLSESGLGLMIENKDPLGAYVVNATVTDHVSGVVLRTTQTLRAVF